jgi:hypothetical protein
VTYFGESGSPTTAGPEAVPDADGLSNLQEYAFGMNPSQGSSGMLEWSGSTLQQRGVPKPFASGTAGSFTFRAVFARRKDFSAAGLSYTVEFSGDLSSWRASTATPSVLADDSEIQAVSVPYPFFVNGKKATSSTSPPRRAARRRVARGILTHFSAGSASPTPPVSSRRGVESATKPRFSRWLWGRPWAVP